MQGTRGGTVAVAPASALPHARQQRGSRLVEADDVGVRRAVAGQQRARGLQHLGVHARQRVGLGLSLRFARLPGSARCCRLDDRWGCQWSCRRRRGRRVLLLVVLLGGGGSGALARGAVGRRARWAPARLPEAEGGRRLPGRKAGQRRRHCGRGRCCCRGRCGCERHHRCRRRSGQAAAAAAAAPAAGPRTRRRDQPAARVCWLLRLRRQLCLGLAGRC